MSEYNGNIGYLFYKKMYEELSRKGSKKNHFWEKTIELWKCEKANEKKQIKKEISKMLEEKSGKRKPITFYDRVTNQFKEYKKDEKKEEKVKLGNETFKMRTTYPGLLLGSGYNHDTGLEGDFKLGFFFDYTTGLPIIPGSSVKGLLRSVFPSEKDDEVRREGKREYLSDILGNDSSFEELKSIELDIFEGEKNGKNVPMNKRDIFYGAHIVKGNKKGNILAEDFLCPHGDDPLKNPVPLKMLKVLPEVEFQFNFDLKDGILKTDKKLELFKRILLDFGIGAKTNTGYGQLEEGEK